MFKTFLKLLFSWWNGKTIGTMFYTWKNGIFVGEDRFGNKYYKNSSDKKRWVIFENVSEASKIEPKWHSWMRYTSKNLPLKKIKASDLPSEGSWIKVKRGNIYYRWYKSETNVRP